MSDKISVIVPVYNIEEYLPRCVHSILASEYTDLELLLIDDGSTDNTGALCDELAKEDSRIRVFHKQNGGSSSARNVGLEQASGEYIGFVDSDDFVEPWMFRVLYEGLQKSGAKIAQVGRDEINPDGSKRADICVPPATDTWIESKEFIKDLLMHIGDCSFCTKLLHRSAFEGRQFPVGVLNEDFHLLVQILPEQTGVISLPGYGYHVFYRENSNSRKKNKEEFSRVYADCVDNADYMEDLTRKLYPDLVPVAKRFAVFQRLEYLLHIPISQMRGDNGFYKQVVSYLRKNLFTALSNAYLTKKNKVYMLLFAIAPKTLRQVHKRLRGL